MATCDEIQPNQNLHFFFQVRLHILYYTEKNVTYLFLQTWKANSIGKYQYFKPENGLPQLGKPVHQQHKIDAAQNRKPTYKVAKFKLKFERKVFQSMFRLEKATKNLERENCTLQLKLVWTTILLVGFGLFPLNPASIE